MLFYSNHEQNFQGNSRIVWISVWTLTQRCVLTRLSNHNLHTKSKSARCSCLKCTFIVTPLLFTLTFLQSIFPKRYTANTSLVFLKGKDLFSSPRNPVLKTGFPVWTYYTGKALFWPCTGPDRQLFIILIAHRSTYVKWLWAEAGRSRHAREPFLMTKMREVGLISPTNRSEKSWPLPASKESCFSAFALGLSKWTF